MRSFNYLLFVLLAFPLIFHAPPAEARATKKLEEDVAELRRINETQSKNLATAMNQIQEVLSEFQKMHGQVDQNVHSNKEVNKFIDDNQRRLAILEDKIQGLVEQLEEIKAAGLLPGTQSKSLSEFKVYQQGLSKVNAEQYRSAIQSFRSFLKNNRKSRYADEAQYWIGESYYAMRDFPKAVTEYQKTIKKYPKSKKVPISMLKQGLSFYQMQSFDEAKAFFSKLLSKYPRSNEATRARENIKKIDRLLELREKEALEKRTTIM